MNPKAILGLLGSVATFCLLPVADTLARQAPTVPEPSVLSLSAAAAVAGVVAYRLRKKK